MILFVNVFVTEARLGVFYDRGLFPPPDTRFDVFRYMLASLEVIPFSRVYIYYRLDSEYESRYDEMDDYIRSLFPAAYIRRGRNEFLPQWRESVEMIKAENSADELVWYLGNDDHVFVDKDIDYLERLLSKLRELSRRYGYASLLFSHWSQIFGQVYLSQLNQPGQPLLEDTDEYAVLAMRESGSLLVMSMPVLEDFWLKRNLGTQLHFRADGIPSPEMAMLWPKRELLRHYDAYSHQGLDIRTCPPLRIPDGFFEGDIRINYLSDARMPGFTNVNPLNPAFACTSPSGADYRCALDELPLFWRKRISRIEAPASVDENEVLLHHNRMMRSMILDGAQTFSGDLTKVVPAAFMRTATSSGIHIPFDLQGQRSTSNWLREVRYYKLNLQKARPRHSIILVDYEDGSFETLKPFFESVSNDKEIEVIWLSLWNNTPPAALRERAQYLDAWIACHFHDNLHKGAALNVALAECRGEIVTVCELAYRLPRLNRSLLEFAAAEFVSSGSEQPHSVVVEHSTWEVQGPVNAQGSIEPIQILPLPNRICFSFSFDDALSGDGFDESDERAGVKGGCFELADRLVLQGARHVLCTEHRSILFVSPPLPAFGVPSSPIFEHNNKKIGV